MPKVIALCYNNNYLSTKNALFFNKWTVIWRFTYWFRTWIFKGERGHVDFYYDCEDKQKSSYWTFSLPMESTDSYRLAFSASPLSNKVTKSRMSCRSLLLQQDLWQMDTILFCLRARSCRLQDPAENNVSGRLVCIIGSSVFDNVTTFTSPTQCELHKA